MFLKLWDQSNPIPANLSRDWFTANCASFSATFIINIVTSSTTCSLSSTTFSPTSFCIISMLWKSSFVFESKLLSRLLHFPFCSSGSNASILLFCWGNLWITWWPSGSTLPSCRGAGTFPPPKWAGDWFDLPKHSCGAILSLCFLVNLVPGTGVGSNLQPNNYILHSLSLSLDVVVCLNGGNDNDDGHTLTFTISKYDFWSIAVQTVSTFSQSVPHFSHFSKWSLESLNFEWLSWQGIKGVSIGTWYLLQIHQPDSWVRNL